MKEPFDLHVHSTLSDGLKTRQELLEYAKKLKFKALSFADHNVSGIEGWNDLVNQTGNMILIPGIEIDCGIPTRMHILGYYLTDGNKLDKTFQENNMENEYRCREVIKNLNRLYNFNITEKDIDKFKNVYLTKRDIISILFDKKIINDVYEATCKYIGEKTPDYIPMKKMTAKEAINLIRDSGGIPVLAHPVTIYRDKTIEKFEPLLKELINYGLLGLELVNLREGTSFFEYFLLMAKKYKLITTAGSDFHRFERDTFGVNMEADDLLYPLVELGKSNKR